MKKLFMLVAVLLLLLPSSRDVSAQQAGQLEATPFVYTLSSSVTAFSTGIAYSFEPSLSHGTIQIVMADTHGNYRVLLRLEEPDNGYIWYVDYDWSADHTRLFVNDGSQAISIFDNQGNLVTRFAYPHPRISDVRWAGSSNEELLYLLGSRGHSEVHGYNIRTGEDFLIAAEYVQNDAAPPEPLGSPSVSPDGSKLLFRQGCYTVMAAYDRSRFPYPALDIASGVVDQTVYTVLGSDCGAAFWMGNSSLAVVTNLSSWGTATTVIDLTSMTVSFPTVQSRCRSFTVQPEENLTLCYDGQLNLYPLSPPSAFGQPQVSVAVTSYPEFRIGYDAPALSPDRSQFIIGGNFESDDRPGFYLGSMDDSGYRLLEVPTGIQAPRFGISRIVW